MDQLWLTAVATTSNIHYRPDIIDENNVQLSTA